MMKGETQLTRARKGEITPEIKAVAEYENRDPEFIRQEVAAGRLIIPANIHHNNLRPRGIGSAITCKINTNLGSSALHSNIDEEVEKVRLAIKLGTDAIMDLSTSDDLIEIRQAVLETSTVPVGTVPIYEAAARKDRVEDITVDDMLEVIRAQAEQGVDFMTLHCGVVLKLLPLVNKRICGMVSRGGSILATWMKRHGRENPLYEHFDDILAICREHDVAISLGDGMRPGALADAGDEAQIGELRVLGELTLRAWDAGVQVMIEGPGHVPFDQIYDQVKMEQEICHGAPFYVLGPIVTDIAPGYDHITSAIGATMAAYAGAAMLCYVTPKEHLGLPTLEDVRQGVIAYKIAAHAADIARHLPGVRKRDDELSRARYRFDWATQFKLSLDPETAEKYFDGTLCPEEGINSPYCSMCGPKYCAVRMSRELKSMSK